MRLRPAWAAVAPVVDLVRLFVGVSILAFASYTDWQWRRAPNVLWLVMAACGVLLLGADALADWSAFQASWPYLVFAPLLVALMYGFWWFGLIAGGADAKALMAIAILAPFPVSLAEGVPPWASPLPASFSVLGNSLLLFLAIPLGLFVWNTAHGDFRFPHALLGLKREACHVRRGHAWPMEVVSEDGTRRTRLFASRMEEGEIDEAFARVQALGAERVWVTPKIPFMIPLLAGFVTAFLVGDLMITLIERVLPVP